MFILSDTPVTERVFQICSYFDDLLQEQEVNAKLVACFPDGGDIDTNGAVDVVLGYMPSLLALEDPGVEVVLKALASCVVELGDESARLATDFAGALVAAEETHNPEARIRALTLLFNSFPQDSLIRFSIFTSIVETAASTDQLEAILSLLEGDLAPWLDAWGASVDQTRALYKQIYTALASTRYLVLARAYLKKLLLTFQGAEKSALAASTVDTTTYIGQCLSSEDMELFPLFSLDAINNLEGTPAFSLLQAVVNGDQAAFAKAPEAVFSELGVDKATVQRKVHISSLVKALDGETSLSFADLSSRTGIAVDDLEAWLIDAMCIGALEASIDEVNSTVNVKRALSSKFTDADWQAVERGLQQWKENLSSVFATLGEVKLAAEKA